MRNRKNIALSLLITLTALAAIAIVTHGGRGYAAPDKKRVTVLRKKDQLTLKPTAQEIAAQPPEVERELEDKIPKHLPIKIKVKNLKSERWTRDLEIEVTNTSNKPIYYLFLNLSLPDVRSDSNRTMGFQLGFGRQELVSFAAPLKPDDIPIRPGESYTLKIPPQFSRGWERFAEKRKLPKTEPKKILLRFGQLNFGDGTGFSATDGEPIDIHRQQSLNDARAGEGEKVAASTNRLMRRPPASSHQPFTSFLPANFLPVNLSTGHVNDSASNIASAVMDVCGCQGGSCYRLKYSMAACCGYGVLIAASASCSDSEGRCRMVEDQEFACDGDSPCPGNILVSCPTADPTPTPSGTPTPPPTPTPTPTPASPCAEDCTRCNPGGYCEPLPAPTAGRMMRA